MSFGQSFQITPVIMLRAAAAIVNGGKLVTPHFAVKAAGADGETVQEFCYETVTDAITEETSNTMKRHFTSGCRGWRRKKMRTLKAFPWRENGNPPKNCRVVRENTSLPLSVFQVLKSAGDCHVLIDEPQGVYYGGTIAAPVIRELFENILPYLEIYPN